MTWGRGDGRVPMNPWPVTKIAVRVLQVFQVATWKDSEDRKDDYYLSRSVISKKTDLGGRVGSLRVSYAGNACFLSRMVVEKRVKWAPVPVGAANLAVG